MKAGGPSLVLLTAAGDRAFCAGLDVSKELNSHRLFLDPKHSWAAREDPGRKLQPPGQRGVEPGDRPRALGAHEAPARKICFQAVLWSEAERASISY